MELHIFNDGIFNLKFIIDEDENKLYFRVKDLCLISVFDVVNVIKKECLLNHKDEIFINEDGFYFLFPQLPADFRFWYEFKFVPCVEIFI